MGTNYYLQQKPPCECCGRGYEPLHIGKSSAGWCFTLHVIPEEGINNLTDWIRKWNEPGVKILNEYDSAITPEDMLDIITNRSWEGKVSVNWLHQNTAEPGPNGLARHKIGRFCVGHGPGTYDYVVREFS